MKKTLVRKLEKDGNKINGHPGPSGLGYMSGDISRNLGGYANLHSPSPCNLRLLFVLPHPLLLPVLSNNRLPVCSPFFFTSSQYFSCSSFYQILQLVLLEAVIGVGVGVIIGVGGTAMIGVHHLPLVHLLMGDMVGAGNMLGIGE